MPFSTRARQRTAIDLPAPALLEVGRVGVGGEGTTSPASRGGRHSSQFLITSGHTTIPGPSSIEEEGRSASAPPQRGLGSRTPHAAAVLAALLLPACAVVGPDFARPAAPQSSGYLMAGDTPATRLAPSAAPAAAWWTAFGSPELNRTMEQALADSPTLAEAEANLRQAQAAVDAARGAEKPQAELSAGAQRERINTAAFGFTGFPSPTINLFSVGGAVSYDLDLFGGQKRNVEAKQARAEAEARRAGAAYLTLTSDVALQAIRIATRRAEIAAVEAAIADDRRTLELVHKAEQLGGAAPSAGVGAQTQLAEDQALLPALQQDLSLARHALAVLVGKAPADWTAPEFELEALTLPDQIPVSLPSQLVRNRPDILAAEAELHAATAQIGVETARLYPDIRVTAGLTQSALNPADLFSYDASGWNLGAGLTAPLLNGGTLKANRRAAVAAAQAANARYQRTVITAFGQVADALEGLAHADAAVRAQAATVASAQAELRDARLAYEKGGGTLLQVLDAQRSLNLARRDLAVALGGRFAQAVRLYAATGADWR